MKREEYLGKFVTAKTMRGRTVQGVVIRTNTGSFSVKGLSGTTYLCSWSYEPVIVSNPPAYKIREMDVVTEKHEHQTRNSGKAFFKPEAGKKHTITFLDDVYTCTTPHNLDKLADNTVFCRRETHRMTSQGYTNLQNMPKENSMKIFHVSGIRPPCVRDNNGKYTDYRKYWGHIITIMDSRTNDRFAHLFDPDGKRVHHLTYNSFKQFADMLEHVYPELTTKEFKEVKAAIKRANVHQLGAFEDLIHVTQQKRHMED